MKFSGEDFRRHMYVWVSVAALVHVVFWVLGAYEAPSDMVPLAVFNPYGLVRALAERAAFPAPPPLPEPVLNAIRSVGNAVGFLRPAAGTLAPLSAASAVAVAISAFAAVIPLLAAGNALGLVRFGWQSFRGALGILPSRKKIWGTVYDSSTKRPLPFARVQLLDRDNRVLETRIADRDGRYGFLTSPESLQAHSVDIHLRVDTAGYRFPSVEPVTVDALLYDNLYRGGLVTVQQEALIAFDIPLDPARPSTAPLAVKAPSVAMGVATAAMADAGFWIGLIAVPLNFLLSPNYFTFGILCLFLGTASLRLFGIAEHPFGTVVQLSDGSPVPFALVMLNTPDGRRVAFAVSDESGRYVLASGKGEYHLVAHTPANVRPPRSATASLRVRKGWIAKEIRI